MEGERTARMKQAILIQRCRSRVASDGLRALGAMRLYFEGYLLAEEMTDHEYFDYFFIYWMEAPSSTWASFLNRKNTPKRKYRV
jgi:hypothetical protein